MNAFWLLTFFIVTSLVGCKSPKDDVRECECNSTGEEKKLHAGTGALLATRFQSLDALKSVVQIEYLSASGSALSDGQVPSMVRITHCSNGREIVGELASGVSQGDIMNAQKGGVWKRLGLLWNSPYAIANRADLQRIFILSRRRQDLFGDGDAAFFDLAEKSVANILMENLVIRSQRDTTEKGFLNSFNHITAQALLTSLFSEEMADFVADLHERHNMPEVITGRFTKAQLTDSINNPMDNYVDIINNEWGQEIGKQLSRKYNLNRDSQWSPQLLSDYLNDIQEYYSWAFEIGFMPFRPEEEMVQRFSEKINLVMKNDYR